MASTDYKRLTGSDSVDMRASVFPGQIPRLCPEILAEIFIFCLPDVPNQSWQVECMSSRKAPLLLCSVCSSWRSLAISTPRLWQRLHFRMTDERLMIHTESITRGIRTWLDRSGALPLSICATFWPITDEPDKVTKCRLILEVLSQEISRWESFELHGDVIWVTPPHFGILPMLHSFDISESIFIDGIPFTSAPRLKRLGLYSSWPIPTFVSAIPWDQLVELAIKEPQTISMVIEIIQRCPRLESLLLRVEESDEDGSLTFRSITQHDTLRRLHLDMPPMLPYVNAVTDRLTLPALTDLSLCSQGSTPEVEAKICCSQLVAFFTRSNCKLQEFGLSHAKFGPCELLECLSHQSCQTLTRLTIREDGISPLIVDRELLIRLTYSDVDDDIPLCPKLAHLELNNCYCSDRSFPDLLGRMIQSRCFGRAQDAQLRTLQIITFYSISREDYELLRFSQSNSGLGLVYACIVPRAAHDMDAIPGGGYRRERGRGRSRQ